VTAPTPLDPVTADDLLLDRMAARRATDQDDALATMLLAVARQCDTPLRQRPSGRRRLSRRRTLTALAALGLTASGAGMAAAVEKTPPSSAARTVQSPAAQPDERATGSSSTWGALPPRLVLHQPTGPRATTVLFSLQAPYAVDRTAAPGTTAQVLSTKSVRVAAPPAAASAVPAVPRHPDGSGPPASTTQARRTQAGRTQAEVVAAKAMAVKPLAVVPSSVAPSGVELRSALPPSAGQPHAGTPAAVQPQAQRPAAAPTPQATRAAVRAASGAGASTGGPSTGAGGGSAAQSAKPASPPAVGRRTDVGGSAPSTASADRPADRAGDSAADRAGDSAGHLVAAAHR